MTLRITPAMVAGLIGFGEFVKMRRYGLPAIFASQVVNPQLVMVGMTNLRKYRGYFSDCRNQKLGDIGKIRGWGTWIQQRILQLAGEVRGCQRLPRTQPVAGRWREQTTEGGPSPGAQFPARRLFIRFWLMATPSLPEQI
jgi:hypothetical protein